MLDVEPLEVDDDNEIPEPDSDYYYDSCNDEEALFLDVPSKEGEVGLQDPSPNAGGDPPKDLILVLKLLKNMMKFLHQLMIFLRMILSLFSSFVLLDVWIFSSL